MTGPAAGASRSPGGGDRREAAIVDAFVELADTLVGDYDLLDFLDRLLVRALSLLDAGAGGIMLRRNGELEVLATSGEDISTLELFEVQRGEGPCIDAFRTGETVVVDDLATMVDRWPGFVPLALERGWRAALAVPMALRHDRIGALNIHFARMPGADDRDVRLLRGLADVATISILQARVISARELTVDQLQQALDSRVVVEQAKGRIAERTDHSMPDSFELLRSYARSSNQRIADVAAQVVSGALSIDTLTSDAAWRSGRRPRH